MKKYRLLVAGLMLALTGCNSDEPYSVSQGLYDDIFDVRVVGDGTICLVTSDDTGGNFIWYKFDSNGRVEMPDNGDETCNLPEGSGNYATDGR